MIDQAYLPGALRNGMKRAGKGPPSWQSAGILKEGAGRNCNAMRWHGRLKTGPAPNGVNPKTSHKATTTLDTFTGWLRQARLQAMARKSPQRGWMLVLKPGTPER